jgi:hypothetical protein
VRPDNPGITTTIPYETTTVEENIMIQEHGELMRSYLLAKTVYKACGKCILDAFDDKLMSVRADLIERYVDEAVIYLLTLEGLLCLHLSN